MKPEANNRLKILTGFLLLSVALFLLAGPATGNDDEEDGGTILFTKPVKSVVFEHGIHTEQGLDCGSCHDEIFQMEKGAAEAGEDFTMESLYQGKFCGACHDGETAFASNTRCTACHIGVKGYDRMTGGDKKSGSGH